MSLEVAAYPEYIDTLTRAEVVRLVSQGIDVIEAIRQVLVARRSRPVNT